MHDRRRPLHDYLLERFIRKLIEHAAQNILYQSPERKTNIRLQQEVNRKSKQTQCITKVLHPCIVYCHNRSLVL